MDPDEMTRTITRAEGFLDLGMHADAWETIEELPPDSNARLHPSVIAIRLRVCTGLFRWDAGKALCRFVGAALMPELREVIGRFYLAYAEHLAAGGDVDGVRSYLKEMAEVWPDGRALALESKALRPLFD